MRIFWGAAAVVLALSAGACVGQVQPYGSSYYDDGGYYGADAYGYCDDYGCPQNYWDQPVYYGSIYYGNSWINGPLYYRNWQGRRQYWVHGGWRYDGWSGPRPSQYRDTRYGPALGLSWYRTNHAYRRGDRAAQYRRGYRTPSQGSRDRSNYRGNDNRRRDGSRTDHGSRGNSDSGDRAPQ
jgi:hypothetical protein